MSDSPGPGERGPLFRAEALRARAQRLEGDVLLLKPWTALVFTPVLAALALAGVAFVACARYTRTERVLGYLAPEAGLSTIFPLRAGTVAQVHVAMGDLVEAGTLLLTVNSESALASGAGLELGLRGRLLEQREELRRELEVQQGLFEQHQRARRHRIEELGRQLHQLEAVQDVTKHRRDLARLQEERFAELLARGATSEAQFQEKRAATLEVSKEVEELGTSRLLQDAERGRLRDESEAAPLEQQREQSALRSRLAALETQLQELEGRIAYGLKSPIAGRVAALQASPGSVASPDVPLAVITPSAGRLEAQLLVPTRAAGMLEEGQTVGVKYSAFPFEEFGVQSARIARIERAVLGPGELAASVPVPVPEPVYRVIARLESQEVSAPGQRYPLRAGMQLEAEIALEERSLLGWILQPVYGLRKTPVGASQS